MVVTHACNGGHTSLYILSSVGSKGSIKKKLVEKVHNPVGGFGPSPLIIFFSFLKYMWKFIAYIPHKKHGPSARGGGGGFGS